MEGYLLAQGILYCLSGADIAGQAGQCLGSPGDCWLFVP